MSNGNNQEYGSTPDYRKEFLQLPIDQQEKIFNQLKSELDFGTDFDIDFETFKKQYTNFDPTYTTDEKEEENQNDYNLKDISKETVKGVYNNLSVEDFKNFISNEWENMNLLGSGEKALRTVPKRLFFDIPKWITTGIVTAPEGAYMGDPYGEKGFSDDFTRSRELWQEWMNDRLSKGLTTYDASYRNVHPDFYDILRKEGIPVYDDLGYGIVVRNSNTFYMKKPEEQKQILEDTKILSVFDQGSEWIMSNPLTVDSWEDIEPTYINTMAQAIPDLAIQIGLSYAHPALGMSYAGLITGSDQFTTAQPYIENGDLTPQEAFEIATLVSGASVIWNYGPSMIYSATTRGAVNKEFQKRLFDKIFKKQLYKKIGQEKLKSGLAEAIQETGDELTAIYAESTYRDDMTMDEITTRIKLSAVSGFFLGAKANAVIGAMNHKQRKKYIEELVKTENMLLPTNVSIDNEGNLNLDLNRDNFDSDEQFNQVKDRYDEIIKNIDPDKLRKEYPDVPLNLLIFNHLFNNNPLFEGDSIEYDAPIISSIMTDVDLLELNYDPDNLKWKKVEIKEGDENYVEGERRFKVWTLGSNIYDSSGGRIVLTQGASQDVFVEEVVELLYKRLETENPDLKQRIDRWIEKTQKALDGKGPTGIELFSKFYTFNFLGYADTEFDLAEITTMPKEILNEFGTLLGTQSDGTDLSFLFNGDIEKTLKLNVEEQVEETTEPIETKDVEEGESFRIEPQEDNPPVQETPIKTYRLQPTGNKILYHTTLTKNVDSILENGLKPLQTTLWVTPDGERHGNGEIYVFESLEDAKAWKIKMEFDLGEDATILQINNNTDMWEADIDEATGIPKNILGPDSGQWFRRFDTVPSEDIKVFNEGESFRLEPNPEYKGDEVRDNIYSVLPDKDTESNLRKKLNRNPKIGSPKNKSKTLVNDNYRMTVGNKTIDQWIKDVENNMTPEQIMEARVWYDNYIEDIQPLTDGSPESAIKFVLGSLVTQVNESPEGAINNLLLAYEEEISNLKGNKKAGLNDEAVRQLFTEDGKIKSGIGQKLFDFIDSAIGNNTRYLMGNDPRGGSPYTADIHTSRGRGFIDSAFYNALERAFGKNKIKSLVVDFGGNPTETQYENTSAFGNELTNRLNDINWMGQQWTTQQVQAVDWVNVINFLGDYGVDAGGTMGDAILGNTQKITSALVFGEGTPYSKKFPQIYDMTFDDQLEITKKINTAIIKTASEITGVKSNIDFHKQGFWKDYSAEPTTTITTIASKDGIQSFMDVLGYLAQQTSIVGSKNNPTGKNTILYFYDVDGNFKNLKKQDEFYKKLREVAPDIISGASSDYVMIDGKKIPALSVITNFKAPSKITRVKEKADYILKETEDFINLHKESLQDFDGNIDIKMALGDMLESNNNWEEKNNGQDYIERLVQRYGRGIQTRLENSSRRIESLIEEEISKKNESYRLEPVDPDELTPEALAEIERQETLNNIYSDEDRPPPKPEDTQYWNSLWTQIDKTLRPISSILKDIHPSLKEALRNHEFKVHQKQKDARIIISNFYNSDNYKNMSENDKAILDLAMKNRDIDKINEIVSQNNLTQEYEAITTLLENIRTEGIEHGMEIGYLENYIPRKVLNRDGLLSDIYDVDPEFQTKIEKRIEDKEAELNRKLDESEIHQIIDVTLRGFNNSQGGMPNIKERKIQYINNNLNQYYAHSSEALLHYVLGMNQAIENRIFLGQSDAELGFSEYVRKVADEYGLTTEQEKMLEAVIDAKFGNHEYGNLVPKIKNLTYITTMGSPISALTQIGDMTWSLYQAGVFGTLQAVVGEKVITIEDLGIDRIGMEFETKDKTSKAVETVFKYTGLTWMDRLGKETLINSVFNKYQAEAKNVDWRFKNPLDNLSKDFQEDITNYFDPNGEADPERIKQLVKDFAEGNISEDVKYLLFNKLLDHQPVAESEMPIRYLNSPGGRLFYQLKTFTLKQLDVTRSLYIDRIKNAKGFKAKVSGMRDLIRLLTMWLIAGVTSDTIKDLVLGRPIDISDNVIENLYKFAGASRYDIWNARRNGLDRAIVDRFVPVSLTKTIDIGEKIYDVATYDDLSKREENLTDEEISELRGDEQREDYYELLSDVPFFGKIAWWWLPEGGQTRVVNQKLKEYKEMLDYESLSDEDQQDYEFWLDKALGLDIITNEAYDRRLDAMKN